MADQPDLSRFLTAQAAVYDTALAELQHGQKTSHWMWFIFPQLAALGRSGRAKYYGIAGAGEAQAYLAHPVLGPRLEAAAEAMLGHAGRLTAVDILGPVDALKLRSSATLFGIAGAVPTMQRILDVFYRGEPCAQTLEVLAPPDPQLA